MSKSQLITMLIVVGLVAKAVQNPAGFQATISALTAWLTS